MDPSDNSLVNNIPHGANCHKSTDQYRKTEKDTETQEYELKTIIELHGQDKALEYLATKRDCSEKDLNSALITACQRGLKFLIQSLLHQGANIDCRNKDENTPLMISVSLGFIAIARFLIKKKANINSVNAHGDTALMLCLRSAGSVEMVKLFLQQKDIDLDHQNQDGYTALMKAVETLDIDVIKLLLNKQKLTAIQKRNCRGETAEQIADKLEMGSLFRLLSTTNDRDLIVKAVETNDTDLLQIVIDCYASERSSTHEIVLTEIFKFHDSKKIPFENKHEYLLRKILKIGVDMTNKNPHFDPLAIAARLGCANVLQLLLENGAQPCIHFSRSEKSPLVEAAESGRIDLLDLLVKHGAKVNDSILSRSPSLKCAIENGHLECADYLIQQGAEICLETVLQSAISSQNLETVKYLCKRFQGYKSMKVISDMLVFAARIGHLEIINILLKAGANVKRYFKGKTALMESRNGEVVNFLIKKGAIVNKWHPKLREYHSPLTCILANNDSGRTLKEEEEVVEALLNNGAAVNGKSSSGRTPLMMTVSARGYTKIIQMLLNHGADVNARDKDGSSVLLLAAQKNCSENVTTILQNIKNCRNLVNTPNYRGLTSLMAAVEKGNHQMMMELIEAGADVNLKDNDGRSAMFHAITRKVNNLEQIITSLVTAGSDINLQDSSGSTPLMWAARCRSEKCTFELLLKYGADINFVNKKSIDETALSVLIKVYCLESDLFLRAECMLEHGAHASYVGLSFLHSLILNDHMNLIQRLICSGVGPAEVSPKELKLYCTGQLDCPVSPLCVSLLIGNIGLARYLVDNLFLTRTDVFSLGSNTAVRQLLKEKKFERCLELLDKLSSQPVSLQKLGLLAVIEAIGPAPGRENRINKLPLPQPIKDKLLFKTPGVCQQIPADRETAAGVSSIRTGFVSSARNALYETVLASLMTQRNTRFWDRYEHDYNYYLDDEFADYNSYDSDY